MTNTEKPGVGAPPNRPYTDNHRLRLAVAVAFAAVGLFVLSTPAWMFSTAENATLAAILGGGGGVLMGFGLGAIVSEQLDPTLDAVREAFSIENDGDRPGTFRAAIREEVSRAVAEVAASAVDFGPRARLFQRLQISATETEIIIQSISLSQKWQMTQLLEELFSKRPNLAVRILLMHPYSPHVATREADLTFSPGTLRQLIDETILPLASLRTSLDLGSRLAVRGYMATPYYGITCCDRKRLTISLSRERRGGDQNLGIYVEASSQAATELINDLVAGFELRWEAASNILDFVAVSFVPGSERAEGDRVVFEVESSEPLAAQSIVCQSDTANAITIAESGHDGQRYIISGTVMSDDRPQRFVVEQASAHSGAWLRAPIDVPLPPLSRLGPKEAGGP